MNKSKIALLVIDGQNDFCRPGGALFVDGADKDMERLAKWINKNGDAIDHISLTLDSHHVNDIAHPSYWQDKDGKSPDPYTQITADEVKSGKWAARFYPNESLKYLEELEAQGEFPHLIWPPHCLIGSEGNAIFGELADAVNDWASNGKYPNYVMKGTYPVTEHFGVFHAQVPSANRPETQLNQELIATLEKHDVVYFAGEAKSHCVATSLKQALKDAPTLAQKFIILEDCMSPVTGYEDLATPIYEEAKKEGIRFSTTKDEQLIGDAVTA